MQTKKRKMAVRKAPLRKKTNSNAKNAARNSGVVEALNKSPTEENWKLFDAQMKKDKAKYYYIYYPTDLKGKNDLESAYAVIYDGRYKQLYKIPVIRKLKKGIDGATIHLKDLELNRKVIS